MSKYVIETKDLTKKYGDKESVSKLNLHIRKNTIYGLLGRNGAGKTTTMKMILGLTQPTEGEVLVFGKNMEKNQKRILPRIGCLVEAPGFYPNLTGTENLQIFAELRGVTKRTAVKEALEVVGLKYKDKKLFSQYSLGMKQRLAIALAIMHDPEILILDEPINGLDPIGIAEIREFIKNLCKVKGKTILISSHILSEIALLADDIGIIDNGELLEESTLQELEMKNKKYVHFVVSDSSQASRILETDYQTKDFKVTDANNIYLYDTSLPLEKVNVSLINAGVGVTEMHLQENTLEDYFKEVTGGVGIA